MYQKAPSMQIHRIKKPLPNSTSINNIINMRDLKFYLQQYFVYPKYYFKIIKIIRLNEREIIMIIIIMKVNKLSPHLSLFKN